MEILAFSPSPFPGSASLSAWHHQHSDVVRAKLMNGKYLPLACPIKFRFVAEPIAALFVTVTWGWYYFLGCHVTCSDDVIKEMTQLKGKANRRGGSHRGWVSCLFTPQWRMGDDKRLADLWPHSKIDRCPFPFTWMLVGQGKGSKQTRYSWKWHMKSSHHTE